MHLLVLPNALSWTILAGTAAAAEPEGCEQRVGTDQVVVALDAAESALLWLEIESFRLEMARLDDSIRCLGEVLPPAVVADLHRFRGLQAFGERDPIASRAFAAARWLEPGYRFPEALIGPDSPVLAQFDAIDLAERRVIGLDPPAEGQLYLDGSPGLDRPVDWPVVVQHLTPAGVAFSRWLRPEEAIPPYPVASGGPAAAEGEGRPPLTLLAATGGAAVLSGVLYGAALNGQHRYKDLDDPVPDDQLAGLRTRTNGLVVASAVGAAATVGGAVAVALTW